MGVRRTFVLAALGAGFVLAGCQDPKGEGMPRKGKLAATPLNEFPGERYAGGLEDPTSVGQARANEGVTPVSGISPRYEPQTGIGGSGAENPLQSDQPMAPVPSDTRLESWRGGPGPERSRNAEGWGPSAPAESGDAPDKPDLRLTK